VRMVMASPVTALLAVYLRLDGLMSVTNEHTMVVEKSHACHNASSAFFGCTSCNSNSSLRPSIVTPFDSRKKQGRRTAQPVASLPFTPPYLSAFIARLTK
jgi:hypothetical protein